MKHDTTERELYNGFLEAVSARGRAVSSIYRGDGGPYKDEPDECYELHNQVLAAGLNELAQKLIVTSRSAYGWIAVGTLTTVHSLGSVWGGEVSRKAGATLTTSKMTGILVCTWGGAADSVTSVVLETASIVNNVSSGLGIPLNVLTGVAATLAGSDILKLEMQFQIGSHNL